MFKNLIFFVFLVCLIGCKNTPDETIESKNFLNKIGFQIKQSANNSLSDSIRKVYISEAYKNSNTLENDSLKINYYNRIAYNYYLLSNIDKFRDVSLKALKLTIKNKDTINSARLYSNLGFYYDQKFINDSAFHYHYLANKLYNNIGDDLLAAHSLLSLATIQESEKDYIGAEINGLKAISTFKNSNQKQHIYLSYNLLAVIYNGLGDFTRSVEYHKKAYSTIIENRKELNQYKSSTLNNIGFAYNKKGDYLMAISYYERALNDKNLFKNEPDTYAVLIDNLAYARFKSGNYDDLPELFYRALKIRDSLNIIDGILIGKLHLSEYFASNRDTIKAIKYAKESVLLAQKNKNYRDLLVPYKMLSDLVNNKKGKIYLKKYITLSDSLLLNERKIKEKFTRIAYQTNEVIQEKNTAIKKKWQWIIIAFFVALLSALFLIVMKQQNRNRELILLNQQEESKNKIFHLMMSRKAKFQDGIDAERKRISLELHDDILSRIFGIRMCLDGINNDYSPESISKRKNYLNKLQNIEKDIRKLSHSLKQRLFLSNNDFISVLDEFLHEQSKLAGFTYNFHYKDIKKLEAFKIEYKIQCLRITQEAIFNIIKYANATKVFIAFSKKKNLLSVSISDNGVGFDVSKKSNGIGLKNIRDRVNELGGEISIESTIGNGCQINYSLPI